MTKNARLAVVTKNRTNPAYGGALVGATRIADAHGATIDYYAPETPDSIPEQIALLKEAAAGDYDAMLVMPAHESDLDDTLAQIMADGTPIVFVVTRPKRVKGITFVSSDDRTLAAATAKHLFDHLGGSGKIVIIDGHPNSTTTPDRHAGFLKTAADYPKIEILEMQTGEYQSAPAHAVMRTLLDRYPESDGIVSANDLMSVGIIDALHETGRRIPLVSINGTPDAIAAIKAGDMLSTTEFSTLGFGAVAAEAALRHIAGKPVPDEIMLPTQIITAENIAAWDKPYEERTGLTWADVVGT
jgi:ABC-type sugar transport system substrate-binding protein